MPSRSAKDFYESKATKGARYKTVVPGFKVTPGREEFEREQLERKKIFRKRNTRRNNA